MHTSQCYDGLPSAYFVLDRGNCVLITLFIILINRSVYDCHPYFLDEGSKEQID
jgi:hypothetical protein